MRVRFPAGNRAYVYAISEVLFMKERSGAPAVPDPDAILEAILEALNQRGITRLFAPRYVMNRAHEKAGDRLSVEVPHELVRTVLEETASKNARFIPLVLSERGTLWAVLFLELFGKRGPQGIGRFRAFHRAGRPDFSG